MSKKRVYRFLKRYLIVGIVFCTVLISLDFYIEELTVEDNDITRFPNIELINYLDEVKNIDDMVGDIILVDFWFAECAPCLDGMKYFPELLDKYRGKLSIISYSIDPKEHTKKILQSDQGKWSFLNEKDADWYFLNKNPHNIKSLKDLLKVNFYPTYFVIDKNRNIISKPYNGVYGVEKELNNSFAIGMALRKYISNFEAHKLYIPLIAYNILVVVILLGLFVIRLIKRKIFPKN